MAQDQGGKENSVWELPSHKLCLSHLRGAREWRQTDSGTQGAGTVLRSDPCVLQSQIQHQILWHQQKWKVSFSLHIPWGQGRGNPGERSKDAYVWINRINFYNNRIFHLKIWNTSICRSNMTQTLISSAWISMWFWVGQISPAQTKSTRQAALCPNTETESAGRRPCTGSCKSMTGSCFLENILPFLPKRPIKSFQWNVKKRK